MPSPLELVATKLLNLGALDVRINIHESLEHQHQNALGWHETVTTIEVDLGDVSRRRAEEVYETIRADAFVYHIPSLEVGIRYQGNEELRGDDRGLWGFTAQPIGQALDAVLAAQKPTTIQAVYVKPKPEPKTWFEHLEEDL